MVWKRKRIIIGEEEEFKGSKGGLSYQEVEEDEACGNHCHR